MQFYTTNRLAQKQSRIPPPQINVTCTRTQRPLPTRRHGAWLGETKTSCLGA